MWYKIGFFDLDGTLLDVKSGKNAQVSAQNLHAVQKLAKECSIVISTGRKLTAEVVRIGEKISAKFYICLNGAEIFDKNLNLIKTWEIKHEIFVEIINLAKKWKFAIALNSETAYSGNFFKFLFQKFSKYKLLCYKDLEIPKKLNKISIFSLFPQKVKKFKEFLDKKFAHQLQICIVNKGFTLEITDQNASKGVGAFFVADLEKISLDRAFHIGDSDNDVSVKGIVKTLIAMKNSSKNLKKTAHFIGFSKKFGVAKALENFIFKPKTAAVVGKYAVGKTTFLKKVETFGYSVLYTDDFFANCYQNNGDCFLKIKKIRPDFVNQNHINKNKIRDFMVSSQENRDLIEMEIYPILEKHLNENYYHFVEIPNLWTKNANFLKFFSKIIWIVTDEKQRVLNIQQKKVEKSISAKNSLLNEIKIEFYDVKISDKKWKKARFFPKFFRKVFK
ncbi:HAD-IIB family hydrolase [Mycoplasma sp. 'Moose RK']|uniref:HAD-IIB family hydrolase n=1 Tax=Mycoplasma sp. 'Moose RK' TaxID=2780095 RepID=UPI0018C2891B|nr:HAD-IIB family hydrolase [Mycoplasma sp. 'Moose RK']MBG0730691.1 HAD-IIB family hydrolase [Mycoplasma sp. 'Moose RK']